MKRTFAMGLALLLCAAGVITLVTAAAIARRQNEGNISAIGEQSVELDTAAVEAAKVSAEWLTEYKLTDSSGRTFDSHELDGTVHVVSFFFSTCPSVCRQQNSKIQELAKAYGPEGVRFVSITCDPQTDTPAVLTEYARMFNADKEHWHFLTGTDLDYLRKVGAEVYQVPVDKQVHSERLIVVDAAGEIKGTFHWNKPEQVKEMRTTLDLLLSQNGADPNSPSQSTSEG